MRKKILISLGAIGVVSAIAIPIAVVSASKKNDQKIVEIKQNIDSENVFPALSVEEFYKYARFDGVDYHFDKNIVYAATKYVASNLQTSINKFNFDYKFINNKHLELKFVVSNGDDIFTQKYDLILHK
ncbi:MHO_1590 family protein [Mycoplasma simbae]|uniref:MHO_1590 family protein n=1 Tax=Mycoplasma simbae TaxID=36744 RepID=UPI0006922FFA|nr:hypothetical protein [Mycoplasma simbae]